MDHPALLKEDCGTRMGWDGMGGEEKEREVRLRRMEEAARGPEVQFEKVGGREREREHKKNI